MTQFLRDQASDTEEVVTPLMQDGTYLSRNFATLGPLTWQPKETPKENDICTEDYSLTSLYFLILAVEKQRKREEIVDS